MRDHKMRSWMLGPKAENAGVFSDLFLEAYQDYCYWRKNFHPEDAPFVKVEDRADPEFGTSLEELHGHLFTMLSHLKRSIPWFSARYVGHMNTDLLIPGLLGYFSAMFYNQNNIVSEAATITLQFEAEAVRWITGMLQLPEDSSWGHLCSGGTAANCESLWVARNLMFLPYQIALINKKLNNQSIADFQIAANRRFGDYLEDNALRALTTDDIIALHGQLMKICENSDVARIVDQYSIDRLGIANFFELCRKELGDRFPKGFRIFLSRNAHYSLRKSIGLLGLGQEVCCDISLDRDMRLDHRELADNIERRLEDGLAALAVIGVYGSTEEGAIDDFDQILQHRSALESESRSSFWVHGDACYGGYLASLAKPDNTRRKEELRDMFASGLRQKEVIGIVTPEMESRLVGSDSWHDYFIAQCNSLGQCDSISIDPHKLGYIPYPAGAVCYRDYRVRELIRCDAPYLNAGAPTGTTDQWATQYLGKYTLEGSRPGATSAALWLAHKAVPLDRTGHGRLMRDTLLGARLLQCTLETRLPRIEDKDHVSCHFLCEEPDSNILCYSFGAKREGQAVPLAVINRVVDDLYNRMLPTEEHPPQTCDFVASKTSLGANEYGDTLDAFIEKMGLNADQLKITSKVGSSEFNPWRDDTKINLIRTVIMGPFHLSARTRSKLTAEERHLFEEYTIYLEELVTQLISENMNRPFFHGEQYEALRPRIDGRVLIVEDNIETQADLRNLLMGSFKFDQPVRDIQVARSREEALDILNTDPIIAALVDVDLSPSDPEGGLEFLKNALNRPKFKGGVVFSSLPNLQERFTRMIGDPPGTNVSFRSKPSRSDNRFFESCNRVFEDLWDILRA